MAIIYIDNEPYTTPPNKSLLDACLSLGFDIPYFCWHPALGSVGSCRMCAVKRFRDENDTAGKIVMSCMEPVEDGMRISINDPGAVRFRASVIEWLMTNHPHDCPVCDEGGECHLQDMTLMSGHVYRNYRFKKRTYHNQYLGPFISHEMNRCIQCYRCVRYYRDYAGGRDLNVFGSHNHVYFGRHADGTLENVFSGNLVEVCPTGVFTDKTLKRHYTRKWDLTNAPSVCVHCGIGCSIIAGERYGTLRRVLNRYNSEVNGYFLCDRGRFGYEFVNSEKRIRTALSKNNSDNGYQSLETREALRKGGDIIAGAKGIIGIGSPRASLESNFALRTLVGAENFYMGVSDNERALLLALADILKKATARVPSLRDIESSDAVLVLGGGLTAAAPRLELALRQTVRNAPMLIPGRIGVQRWNDTAVRTCIQDEKGPFYIASPGTTSIDDIATRTLRAAPADIARLGFAIAHIIDENAPAATGLDEETLKTAAEIARALMSAEKPLIVSGTAAGDESILHAAANTAEALSRRGKKPGLFLTVPECNSLGLALLGGKSLGEAFAAAGRGEAGTAVIIENDIYRRADKAAADAFMNACGNIISLDCIESRTTRSSSLVLPAGSFAESTGTLVSGEGRAQRFYRVFAPAEGIRESWRLLAALAAASDKTEPHWNSADEITAALAAELPVFSGITEAAPPATLRINGLKVGRQTHRYSGRTAISAQVNVREVQAPDDPDSPLAFSMEGTPGIPPGPLVPYFWAPGWNSVQAVSRYQREVNGPLHGGDPGKRLIEPAGPGNAEYFTKIPRAYSPAADEYLVLALHHVFGSEELSAHAPAVAARIPEASIVLNPEDAAVMALTAGEEVMLHGASLEIRIPLKIGPGIPRGCAMLSAGLPGIPFANLPIRARLSRVPA